MFPQNRKIFISFFFFVLFWFIFSRISRTCKGLGWYLHDVLAHRLNSLVFKTTCIFFFCSLAMILFSSDLDDLSSRNPHTKPATPAFGKVLALSGSGVLDQLQVSCEEESRVTVVLLRVSGDFYHVSVQILLGLSRPLMKPQCSDFSRSLKPWAVSSALSLWFLHGFLQTSAKPHRSTSSAARFSLYWSFFRSL